jgi:transcriptional regulator with XRE-family HTH domain
MNTLEDRIKYLRKNSKLSQRKFADQLGLAFRTVQRYEVDASTMNVRLATQIASMFNVDIDWLLTGNKNKEKNIKEDGNIVQYEPIVSEHMDVFNKFKNQERAKRLCEKLLMLESISENQLDKIEQDIDKRVEIAEDVVAEIKKAESIMDQNESDRRKKTIIWTNEERRKKAAS